MKLQIDKKLGNRREPININIYHISFHYGQKKIKVEKIKIKSRSGFCLDRADGKSAVDIDELGFLVSTPFVYQEVLVSRHWECFCLEEDKEFCISLLKQVIAKDLLKKQKLVNSLEIPE